MELNDLSVSNQDYLKAIWNLGEWRNNEVPNSELAKRLGVSSAAVSSTVKKLRAQGLVHSGHYDAIRLTDEGKRLALLMVRRHRLIECFLFTTLGYNWDEVHSDAESLEHAVSETFLSRIDALLGHPTVDPHGAPIPTLDGLDMSSDHTDNAITLHTSNPGSRVRVVRVHDEPEALRSLEEAGLVVGTQLIVKKWDELAGAVTVELPSGKDLTLSTKRSKRILVTPI